MAHQPLHKALARPGAVAYLLAHHEHLVAQGVFMGQQAASIVFMYLCKHPGAQRPGGDQEARWKCPVDALDPDHNKLTTIAKYTGLDVSNVRRALNWLDAQGLIHVDRLVGGEGKRMGYGPITILSTNWLSDLDRKNAETRRNLEQARTASNHHASPAKMHSASNKRTPPLNDDTPAPSRPRRTVAGTRATWANGHDLEASGILENAPPVRMVPGDSRPSDAPDTRPVGTSEGRSHVKAGHSDIPDATIDAIEDSALMQDSHDSVVVDGLGVLPGSPSRDAVDAEVDLVMARLYESGLWSQDAHAVVA